MEKAVHETYFTYHILTYLGVHVHTARRRVSMQLISARGLSVLGTLLPTLSIAATVWLACARVRWRRKYPLISDAALFTPGRYIFSLGLTLTGAVIAYGAVGMWHWCRLAQRYPAHRRLPRIPEDAVLVSDAERSRAWSARAGRVANHCGACSGVAAGLALACLSIVPFNTDEVGLCARCVRACDCEPAVVWRAL